MFPHPSVTTTLLVPNIRVKKAGVFCFSNCVLENTNLENLKPTNSLAENVSVVESKPVPVSSAYHSHNLFP
jgi:hypothetical protein